MSSIRRLFSARRSVEVGESSPEEASLWPQLPWEIQLWIGQSIESPRDLLALGATCKAFRSLGQCELLWKALCVSKFAADPASNPPSWKKLYRYNHELLYNYLLRSSSNIVQSFHFQPGRAIQIQMHA
eukprot:CAMPEP_0117657416 /NCGR_PEP_ID=MMETSP0804-20121206/5319_1 /TAXON_ID=1074897 /ORGANISM="Tetraselmis astigmatica, Strain CCMP880" /LENGTH=127 /DNA_ID=CAMNT_0005463869 /DNA_START=82 /DNA_END=465 /DNA_ORIENTATION=+